MSQPNSEIFTKFAKLIAKFTGKPITFAIAALTILVWCVSGPLFDFSDTWQLVINTGTTIVTFLMVFLIQNTQNRDTGALQIKLDEIIRVLKGAHNELMDLEEQSDEQLDAIRGKYDNIAKAARNHLACGDQDTDCPEVEETENKDV